MATLVSLAPRPWPADAAWIARDPAIPALHRAVVFRAWKDIGMLETPLGSNRGPEIDAMTTRYGLPVPKDAKTKEGWWWCAIWAGTVFVDAGAKVPDGYASCDHWLEHVRPEPAVGAAILYGVKGDAHHIGVVARLAPLVLTIEGNRGYAGTTNNGVAVDIGPQMRKDVLGYIWPQPA